MMKSVLGAHACAHGVSSLLAASVPPGTPEPNPFPLPAGATVGSPPQFLDECRCTLTILTRSCPPAVLENEERAVQIACNTDEGSDAALVTKGPLTGPLLKVLGMDVPREGPLPKASDRPTLPRMSESTQRVTCLMCRSYVLDGRVLERNALREAARALQTAVQPQHHLPTPHLRVHWPPRAGAAKGRVVST